MDFYSGAEDITFAGCSSFSVHAKVIHHLPSRLNLELHKFKNNTANTYIYLKKDTAMFTDLLLKWRLITCDKRREFLIIQGE